MMPVHRSQAAPKSINLTCMHAWGGVGRWGGVGVDEGGALRVGGARGSRGRRQRVCAGPCGAGSSGDTPSALARSPARPIDPVAAPAPAHVSVAGDQNVFGLDVAVHDAEGVQVVQGWRAGGGWRGSGVVRAQVADGAAGGCTALTSLIAALMLAAGSPVNPHPHTPYTPHHACSTHEPRSPTNIFFITVLMVASASFSWLPAMLAARRCPSMMPARQSCGNAGRGGERWVGGVRWVGAGEELGGGSEREVAPCSLPLPAQQQLSSRSSAPSAPAASHREGAQGSVAGVAQRGVRLESPDQPLRADGDAAQRARGAEKAHVLGAVGTHLQGGGKESVVGYGAARSEWLRVGRSGRRHEGPAGGSRHPPTARATHHPAQRSAPRGGA